MKLTHGHACVCPSHIRLIWKLLHQRVPSYRNRYSTQRWHLNRAQKVKVLGSCRFSWSGVKSTVDEICTFPALDLRWHWMAVISMPPKGWIIGVCCTVLFHGSPDGSKIKHELWPASCSPTRCPPHPADLETRDADHFACRRLRIHSGTISTCAGYAPTSHVGTSHTWTGICANAYAGTRVEF